MYIYIYIEREREGERNGLEGGVWKRLYIYIYIHTHIHIYFLHLDVFNLELAKPGNKVAS